MKKRFIFLFLFVIQALCQAQNSLTGTLKTIYNTPVDYANVVLLAQADSTFLAGTVSAEDGSFALTIPANADLPCVMRVTNIGYKTISQPVRPGNVGVLLMESDTQMLGEVVVKGDLPVTRLKGDGMLTNIEGSVLAKAGTAQNVLNYIPGVVSQKGELNVLGRGTPVVYINGRLMRDDSELEQLSSEDILSVEVVNNPGARYNASVKAVIRIQTKHTVGDGLGFANRAYISYNKGWDLLEQLNLNYRRSGLDVFGMLYLYRDYWQDKMVVVQDTYLDQHWRQILKGYGEKKDRDLTTDLGMNYTFNPNHFVGFKYRFERRPGGSGDILYDAVILRDGTRFEQTQSVTQLANQSTKHTVNLYYSGKVNHWTIDLNTDLLWTDSDEDSDVLERLMPEEGTSSEQPVNTYSNTRNRLYASKLIFSHPLLGGDLAFGSEFSHTNRNTGYRNPQGILDDDDSEIKENNIAAFAEYSRALGKFRLQAGLRYERTSFDYYESSVRKDEQSRKYNDFFPSISVGTSLGKVDVQLSYTQDISRPAFYSLRSSVFYANHYTYETGNPFLVPTITHNLAVTGVYKWWQLYASYQRQKDDVMFTMEPYSTDDPNVALIKPLNIKSYHIAYARITATPTIGIWSPRFTAAVRKQWLDVASQGGKRHLNKPQRSFRWQNSLKLPGGLLFGLDGSWYSKHDVGNSRLTKVSWGIDANIYKGFWKDRLTFQLNAYDIFLTRRNDQIDFFNEIYTMSDTREPNSRRVSLTVRYKFNQGKNKYKGTGAGESQKNRL